MINLWLPPRRERPEDIRWQTERTLAQLRREHRRPSAVSDPFMRDVLGRTWKGNAKQLRCYLEQAVALAMKELSISRSEARARALKSGLVNLAAPSHPCKP
jgi:DNA-binding NtrC family response regulator